jgi:hypothetical protein
MTLSGEISSLRISGGSADFTVSGGSGENVIVMPWYYFPGWQAKVDGDKHEIFPSVEGFLELHLLPGSHDVSIRFGTTWPRVSGWIIPIFT